MQEVIVTVRSRVLQLVSQADDQLLDPHDVDSHVRTRDAFIRMFCEHYRVNHSDKDYDIESISQKMLQTLKWRKTTGLTTIMTTEDIPVEFWNTKALLIHEDDEYLISVYLFEETPRHQQAMARIVHHLPRDYSGPDISGSSTCGGKR